jgi:hypothetical protein
MNIYLAGKISDNDWRSEIVDGINDDVAFDDSGDMFPIKQNAIFGKHHYTGPYCVKFDSLAGKHFCYNSHGFIEQDNSYNMDSIHRCCKEAIKNSDVVIAVIHDNECYGTIFELGYAHALNKPIWIIKQAPIDDEQAGYEIRSFNDGDITHYSLEGNELWFTLISAEKVLLMQVLDIKKAIKILLDIKEPFDYKAYLLSDKWKEIRDRIVANSNGCVVCDSTDSLNVHHKTYKNIGNENDNDLIVLCKSCHGKFHNKRS